MSTHDVLLIELRRLLPLLSQPETREKALKEAKAAAMMAQDAKILSELKRLEEGPKQLQEVLCFLQELVGEEEVVAPQKEEGSLSESLMDLFAVEAEAYLNEFDLQLITLEKEAQSLSALEALMRAAHSMKGASRLVGLPDIGKLAHTLEDAFVAMQKGERESNSSFIDAALTAVDMMRELSLGKAVSASILEGVLQALEKGRGVPQQSPSLPDKRKIRQEDFVRLSSPKLSQLLHLSAEAVLAFRWWEKWIPQLVQLKRSEDQLEREIRRVMEFCEEHSLDTSLKEHFRRIESFLTRKHRQINHILEEAEDHTRSSLSLTEHLYNDLTHLRMCPFSEGVQGFPRMVRDMARSLGKKVNLAILGANVPVDRDVLTQIESPLQHLVRNALDHGIESPQERIQKGKKEEGTITLQARHHKGKLWITVRDDGKGVDLETIREKAVRQKFVAERDILSFSPEELLQLLFLPGFSTREEVSDVSGRGVGLDIVHHTVHRLGGALQAYSSQEGGVEFSLKLPLTLSILRVLIVSIREELYAFPLAHITKTLFLAREAWREEGSRKWIDVDDEKIPLVWLADYLQKERSKVEPTFYPVVILGEGPSQQAFVVDHFLEQEELVIQELDPLLGEVNYIEGGALRSDGTPILLFDTEQLLDYAHPQKRHLKLPQGKQVLIVDDSAMAREQIGSFFHGKEGEYRVYFACNGKEALASLKSKHYDLLVTDLDMPVMNGEQLIIALREDAKNASLPILVISERDSKEERIQGYLRKEDCTQDAFWNCVEEIFIQNNRSIR